MFTRLIIHPQPIIDIRQRGQRYARTLAQTTVAHLHQTFGARSPAPAGSPPARKSGTLARSIAAVRLDAYRWRVVVGAQYGAYLEFGTKRMAARPFFRRAIESVRQNPPRCE